MKKIFAVMMVCLLVVSLMACGSSDQGTGETTATTQQSSETAANNGTGKELVVYFSWSGNTEALAKEVQSQTGADTFEIVPETPYSEDYDELLDFAREEQQNDARPAISGSIESFEDYDVIYVGYPNWWGDLPMILYTLFDDYDFSGKTIVPFCTSGGSGLSGTENAIKSLEPDATVLEGFHVEGSGAADAGNDVTQWLESLNLND